jgi:hypothetical protein
MWRVDPDKHLMSVLRRDLHSLDFLDRQLGFFFRFWNGPSSIRVIDERRDLVDDDFQGENNEFFRLVWSLSLINGDVNNRSAIKNISRPVCFVIFYVNCVQGGSMILLGGKEGEGSGSYFYFRSGDWTKTNDDAMKNTVNDNDEEKKYLGQELGLDKIIRWV